MHLLLYHFCLCQEKYCILLWLWIFYLPILGPRALYPQEKYQSSRKKGSLFLLWSDCLETGILLQLVVGICFQFLTVWSKLSLGHQVFYMHYIKVWAWNSLRLLLSFPLVEPNIVVYLVLPLELYFILVVQVWQTNYKGIIFYYLFVSRIIHPCCIHSFGIGILTLHNSYLIVLVKSVILLISFVTKFL